MQIKTNSLQKELKEHGNHYFPLLVSNEKLSRYESGSFLWHWHPEIELTIITKGQMIYKINNITFHLYQGQALFGNSGTLHAGSMFENSDCEYTSITFDARLIYGYDNSIIYTKYVNPIIQDFTYPAIHFDFSQEYHYRVMDILHELLQIDYNKEPTYELDTISLLTQFWKLLVLNHDSHATFIPYDQDNYNRIRNIILYIENNYDSDLALDEISNYVHLSRSTCSRLFTKHMSLSLFEYISEYRVEKSVSYLTRTDLSITEIAKLVGYNDSNYFSKVFRKIKGCSPRQYRENSQR